MSAPTAAPPDIEIDIELDLEMDIEPGCISPDCDADAEWAGLLSACRHTLLVCSDCRIDFEQRIARRRAQGTPVDATHNGCPAKSPTWTWRRL